MVEVDSVFFLVHVLFGLLADVFVLDLLAELLVVLLLVVVGRVVAVGKHSAYEAVGKLLRVDSFVLPPALLVYLDLLVKYLLHSQVGIFLLVVLLAGPPEFFFPLPLGLDLYVVHFEHLLLPVLLFD